MLYPENVWARKEARDELSEELRKLRIELAEAQTTLAELRQVLASERAKVVDREPLAEVILKELLVARREPVECAAQRRLERLAVALPQEPELGVLPRIGVQLSLRPSS